MKAVYVSLAKHANPHILQKTKNEPQGGAAHLRLNQGATIWKWGGKQGSLNENF